MLFRVITHERNARSSFTDDRRVLGAWFCVSAKAARLTALAEFIRIWRHYAVIGAIMALLLMEPPAEGVA